MVEVDEIVVRKLSDVIPMELKISAIQDGLIFCGPWTFKVDTGFEVDENLGWDGVKVTGSILYKKMSFFEKRNAEGLQEEKYLIPLYKVKSFNVYTQTLKHFDEDMTEENKSTYEPSFIQTSIEFSDTFSKYKVQL